MIIIISDNCIFYICRHWNTGLSKSYIFKLLLIRWKLNAFTLKLVELKTSKNLIFSSVAPIREKSRFIRVTPSGVEILESYNHRENITVMILGAGSNQFFISSVFAPSNEETKKAKNCRLYKKCNSFRKSRH